MTDRTIAEIRAELRRYATGTGNEVAMLWPRDCKLVLRELHAKDDLIDAINHRRQERQKLLALIEDLKERIEELEAT